jgi:L-rhamnose-H+ transport protein
MIFALFLTLVAGILGGSVLAPIKRMKQWPFQNSWALYSFWAYAVMPWAVGLATVPNLLSIYPKVSLGTKLICGALGLGWGGAVVLFGVAVNLAGLTLASAIIYGASVAVGSLTPLLISHPEQLATPEGLLILAGNAVMVSGIVLCAWAGKLREHSGARQAEDPDSKQKFRRGLLASIVAAVLCSLFNIALAYGGEFNRLAIANGASPLNAANAQWAFTVSFGYLPNLVVSLVRLTRGREWGNYRSGPAMHWIWPPLMGLMWIGSTALYGSAAAALGGLGPIIGWPIFMSIMILTGSLWGWLSGEWTGAPRRAVAYLAAGIAAQVAAITILSMVKR